MIGFTNGGYHEVDESTFMLNFLMAPYCLVLEYSLVVMTHEGSGQEREGENLL